MGTFGAPQVPDLAQRIDELPQELERLVTVQRRRSRREQGDRPPRFSTNLIRKRDYEALRGCRESWQLDFKKGLVSHRAGSREG
jgi:hypothetical protein